MLKLLLPLVLCSSSAMAATSLPDNRHIVVKGEAVVRTAPDRADITLEFEAVKAESVQAKQQVDTQVNELLAGLNNFSIDEKSISAGRIFVEPNMRYDENDNQVKDGFRATRKVKVSLKKLSLLDGFLNFALKVGVNQIDQIQLLSTKASDYEQAALDKAVANAKQQGSSLASAFEAKLGRVYSIQSQEIGSHFGYGSNTNIERIMVTGSRINTVPEGKYLQESITFRASVNVVFDLVVE
ncbi:SIMPL domain-containing protein [Pseudoalteromonas shioyasakiensis]|uniref:SIMPL domain-containing protein n=1 Tax=Pseudoalteromonas shioyasakiensis TaxID=1190813 RepID=A0ABT6U0U4_9GAMM|nr:MULTISPECIES: SIMPL domain-containing protein [Pseudoalteromonas]MDI4669797.1 SIMPL domain-containing protein [Pseudoalteromonas shioyasakiensis]MDI4674618.1 SIMPL domain-containing protein [Pseudoalteromonas shioyasakiensis]MDI4686712.1 SIMPL domain-containing protein [Pseudoalteromonas shioyasakiensis]MDI4705307.1 SIMPL domain-containing protein [Pseudoalteromonas shioyasakiensis]NUJ21760.1 SIMPL domain-containing protein [Pseudoalteromonas sp. 0802]